MRVADDGLGQPEVAAATATTAAGADTESGINSAEHPVFEAVKNCNDSVEAIRNYFELDGVSPNVEDSSGMSVLMHSCWKGFINVTSFLIDQGADVNGGHHEHDYTCLHFAALAGKPDVCAFLLNHGAKVDQTNSVKRTAAQMAAFVGNHDCVAIINNFVPKEDVYYFTRKQPFEEAPKLPVVLAKPLYKLVTTMNINPAKIGMVLKEEPLLLADLGTVSRIVSLMCDREFTNRRDVNEVLSLKYHLIHYIVDDIKKEIEKHSQGDLQTPYIDLWIKAMVVGRESDGYPAFQEDFLRQGVKQFPYKESQLFKMLVTRFSRKDADGAPAADFINTALNGYKGFKDGELCATCGDDKARKACSGCKSVYYCNKDCQRFHWYTHKKVCAKLKNKAVE